MKPNPNNFIIVDKWNYRYIFKPNRMKIYSLIEEYVFKSYCEETEKIFKNFTNIKDI